MSIDPADFPPAPPPPTDRRGTRPEPSVPVSKLRPMIPALEDHVCTRDCSVCIVMALVDRFCDEAEAGQ